LANSPYIVTGNILVNQGVTLTIEPGVTVKFNKDLYMYVDGTLIARGIEGNLITFTSIAIDKSHFQLERTRYLKAIATDDVSFQRFEDKAFVAWLCSQLSDRERYCLSAHYGLNGDEPVPLRRIAELLGISHERVRQIEADALRKLREPLRGVQRQREKGKSISHPQTANTRPSGANSVTKTAQEPYKNRLEKLLSEIKADRLSLVEA